MELGLEHMFDTSIKPISSTISERLGSGSYPENCLGGLRAETPVAKGKGYGNVATSC